MELLMTAAGVTLRTADTMTTTAELLVHAKMMAVMRVKAADTNCKRGEVEAATLAPEEWSRQGQEALSYHGGRDQDAHG